MKKIAILAAAALLTALVVYWVTQDGTPADRPQQIVLQPRTGDPRDPRPPARIDAARSEVERPTAVDSPSAPETALPAKATTGAIFARAVLKSGDVRLDAEISVARLGDNGPERNPAAGRREGDGVLFDGLVPGRYQVTAHGRDVTGFVETGVEVVAGEVKEVICVLEASQPIRGRVRSAINGAPIGNAEVTFANGATCTTTEDGRFELTQAVSRSALDLIVVKAQDFDVITYRQIPIPDPGNIDLVVGGQDLDVVFHVVDDTSAPLPETMRLRIGINPATWEIRRDQYFGSGARSSAMVRVRNLYAAEYRAELSFPGTDLPHQYLLFTTMADVPVQELTFTLNPGATWTGKLQGPEDMIRGAVLEGRDLQSNVVFAVSPEADGSFKVSRLKPGTYVIYLRMGSRVSQLSGSLEVGVEAEIVRDIDYLRLKML